MKALIRAKAAPQVRPAVEFIADNNSFDEKLWTFIARHVDVFQAKVSKINDLTYRAEWEYGDGRVEWDEFVIEDIPNLIAHFSISLPLATSKCYEAVITVTRLHRGACGYCGEDADECGHVSSQTRSYTIDIREPDTRRHLLMRMLKTFIRRNKPYRAQIGGTYVKFFYKTGLDAYLTELHDRLKADAE